MINKSHELWKTRSISRKRGSGRPPCSIQQSEAVVTTNAKLKAAHFYGITSVRKITAHADVSASTSSVYKILKSKKFYPHRLTNVHALSEADFEERAKFLDFTLHKFEGVFNSVLWTDESMFYLTPFRYNLVPKKRKFFYKKKTLCTKTSCLVWLFF